ncbi:MATH domain-containing protein [Aphelenchoides fujianensis]|nr:MATH domain-containing protein [Aphelenchoides fujianensis]
MDEKENCPCPTEKSPEEPDGSSSSSGRSTPSTLPACSSHQEEFVSIEEVAKGRMPMGEWKRQFLAARTLSTEQLRHLAALQSPSTDEESSGEEEREEAAGGWPPAYPDGDDPSGLADLQAKIKAELVIFQRLFEAMQRGAGVLPALEEETSGGQPDELVLNIPAFEQLESNSNDRPLAGRCHQSVGVQTAPADEFPALCHFRSPDFAPHVLETAASPRRLQGSRPLEAREHAREGARADRADVCRRTEHTFTPAQNDWGWSAFVLWADLLDESTGLSRDGVFEVEVRVEVKSTKNLLHVPSASSFRSSPRFSSLPEFRKKVEDYVRVADLQAERGLLDKAIECNRRALEFCGRRDRPSLQRLQLQHDDLAQRKLQQSIERIEKGTGTPFNAHFFSLAGGNATALLPANAKALRMVFCGRHEGTAAMSRRAWLKGEITVDLGAAKSKKKRQRAKKPAAPADKPEDRESKAKNTSLPPVKQWVNSSDEEEEDAVETVDLQPQEAPPCALDCSPALTAMQLEILACQLTTENSGRCSDYAVDWSSPYPALDDFAAHLCPSIKRSLLSADSSAQTEFPPLPPAVEKRQTDVKPAVEKAGERKVALDKQRVQPAASPSPPAASSSRSVAPRPPTPAPAGERPKRTKLTARKSIPPFRPPPPPAVRVSRPKRALSVPAAPRRKLDGWLAAVHESAHDFYARICFEEPPADCREKREVVSPFVRQSLLQSLEPEFADEGGEKRELGPEELKRLAVHLTKRPSPPADGKPRRSRSLDGLPPEQKKRATPNDLKILRRMVGHLYATNLRVGHSLRQTVAEVQSGLQAVYEAEDVEGGRRILRFCLERGLVNPAIVDRTEHPPELPGRLDEREIAGVIFDAKSGGRRLLERLDAQFDRALRPPEVDGVPVERLVGVMLDHLDFRAKEAARLEAEREALRAERREKAEETRRLEEQREAARAQRTALEREHEQLRADREAAEKKRAAVQQEVKRLRAEMAAVRRDDERAAADHARRLEAARAEKRRLADDLAARQSAGQRLRRQLEDTNAAARRMEQSAVQDKRGVQKAAERARAAEVALVELRVGAAVGVLGRRRDEFAARITELQREAAGGNWSAEEVARLQAHVHSLEAVRHTVGERIAETRARSREVVRQLKAGAEVGDLERLFSRTPPEVPALESLLPARKPPAEQPGAKKAAATPKRRQIPVWSLFSTPPPPQPPVRWSDCASPPAGERGDSAAHHLKAMRAVERQEARTLRPPPSLEAVRHLWADQPTADTHEQPSRPLSAAYRARVNAIWGVKEAL